MNSPHLPVLLNEVVEYLKIKVEGVYCDFTIGYGGHSQALIQNLEAGMWIGFDQDMQAINWCQQHLDNPLLTLINDNFVNFANHLQKLHIKKIDGALLDLGVSSLQLDDASRGFSYRKEGPFDMRMDQTRGLSATEYVRKNSLHHLIKILKEYGEIKNPVHVAKVIKQYIDSHSGMVTTMDIEALIKQNVPVKQLYESKHPARLYFQAIRIAVNDELNVLKGFLAQIPDYLNDEAIVAIITFHSLEEKIVGNWIKKLCNPPQLRGVPINNDQLVAYQKLTTKPIVASPEELAKNNRARSAKLFLIQKKKDLQSN